MVPQHYRQYKMLPIPAFYIFAVVALSLRPVYIIGQWTGDRTYDNIDKVQQGTKLCVGIIQDWITLELAIRIHASKGEHDISLNGLNRLKAIFKIVLLVLTVGWIAFMITVIVSAH